MNDQPQPTLTPIIADADLRAYLDARVEIAVSVRDQLWRAALAEFPKNYPELATSRWDWYTEDFTGWPDGEFLMSERSDSALQQPTEWQPIATAPRAEADQNDIWIWAARRGLKLPMLTTWDAEGERWYTFNLALETAHRREPGWQWQPDLWMPVQEVPK